MFMHDLISSTCWFRTRAWNTHRRRWRGHRQVTSSGQHNGDFGASAAHARPLGFKHKRWHNPAAVAWLDGGWWKSEMQ